MNRRKNVEQIKQQYKTGTKLRLIKMEGEPQMKAGIIGTVDMVDDMGQIHMHWETGSCLALDTELDTFEIVAS